jgi:uncharacterized protein (TIGR02265 family)
VAEKLIFDHTVESLLRTLERPIPPAQIAGLDALGIDLSKPLLPAYPLETYSALIGFIARQRFPDLPPEEADFEVGRAFIEAYTTQTLMGRALKGLLRVIGPHRTLERMSRTFRTANNYTQTRLQPLGPTSYELWFNYAIRQGYFRGMVHATLALCGVRQIEVKLAATQGHELTFHVSWQP